MTKLIRTLSEQHWKEAERIMCENNSISEWAGSANTWKFYINRVNTGTHMATRDTYQNNIKVESTETTLNYKEKNIMING